MWGDDFCVLGDRVTLAAGAKVISSMIGDDAYVGANAVVTRDVLPRCQLAP